VRFSRIELERRVPLAVRRGASETLFLACQVVNGERPDAETLEEIPEGLELPGALVARLGSRTELAEPVLERVDAHRPLQSEDA